MDVRVVSPEVEVCMERVESARVVWRRRRRRSCCSCDFGEGFWNSGSWGGGSFGILRRLEEEEVLKSGAGSSSSAAAASQSRSVVKFISFSYLSQAVSSKFRPFFFLSFCYCCCCCRRRRCRGIIPGWSWMGWVAADFSNAIFCDGNSVWVVVLCENGISWATDR